MKNFKTVPITLITGYLGSGKTTLINYLLKNASGYKMAVIVNDIGEVNIDADLIEKGGVVAGNGDLHGVVPFPGAAPDCFFRSSRSAWGSRR